MVADVLSRDTLNCLQSISTIPLSVFLKTQPGDDVKKMQDQDSSSLRVQQMKIPGGDTILVDVFTGRPRILVQAEVPQRVLQQVHQLSHPGIRGTRRLMNKAFLWPKMNSNVKELVDNCDSCHKSKVLKHIKLPPAPIPVPSRRFTFIHLDLVGPLLEAGGTRYFLSCIDRASQWFEVIPLQNIKAKTVCREFVNQWISRYGVPATILTDRGLQFKAHILQQLCQVSGIELIHTTAYHPQTNGLVERLHSRIKESLTARGGQWIDELPWTLLGLRDVPCEDNVISSAERVFGSSLVLPGSLLDFQEASTAGLAQAFRDVSGGVPVRQPSTQPTSSPDPQCHLFS